VTEARICGPQGRTKGEAARDFQAFLPTVPRADLQVFSDGSKNEAGDGAAGCGSVTSQFGIRVDRKAFSLGVHAEVFDAEAAAVSRLHFGFPPSRPTHWEPTNWDEGPTQLGRQNPVNKTIFT
jgi:hypothetical protein